MPGLFPSTLPLLVMLTEPALLYKEAAITN
jgi:hypothetical protein